MYDRASNPMTEYLLKIQLIVTNSEFKNATEASKYETLETKLAGDQYVKAVLREDRYNEYTYDPFELYRLMWETGKYDSEYIEQCATHPELIPKDIRDILQTRMRSEYIRNYVEPNPYYARLSGKPFVGNEDIPADEVIIVPEDFYEEYMLQGSYERDMPVHEMPKDIVEVFLNSKSYQRLLKEYPNLMYLRYIGSNAIPIEVSRPARDGDIIRINGSKLSTYNPLLGHVTVTPDIINRFVNIYNKTRDYVYFSLRGNFNSFYANYDSFIRFLTLYMAIVSTMNTYMRDSLTLKTSNSSTIDNFFQLYGIPSVVMEGKSAGQFLKQLRLLLMDKGTNVVYRVKDLIGYDKTDIFTLVMVKQQKFLNGKPVYTEDSEGNKVPVQDIVFRRLGTTDDNTSYFKFKTYDDTYSLQDITSGDPRWWNSTEVDTMLQDMNYTLSNSKYIQISTHMSSTDIWWQCVILLRSLLDNMYETKNTLINVNFNTPGFETVSVFDAVLIIAIFMNWQFKLSGNLPYYNGTVNNAPACIDMLFNGLHADGSPKDPTPGGKYLLAAFNFHFDTEYPDYYRSLQDIEYLEPDTLLPLLTRILNRETTNLGTSVMTDIKSLYEFIENKILNARTIQEFRYVSDLYSHAFLTDPMRNWYDELDFDVEKELLNLYNLQYDEYASFLRFTTDNSEVIEPIVVSYHDTDYIFDMWKILTTRATEIESNHIYPFTIPDFVQEFNETMDAYQSVTIENSQLPSIIINNYRNIIKSKVLLDINNGDYGPKSFEAILLNDNLELYRYILSLKTNKEQMVHVLRIIVKALESYADTSLSGLEFMSLGQEEYFRILKEVITYFKSYMVEFTKDEFVYIFGGILDNGGNPELLHLYDEIAHIHMKLRPIESIGLYDISRMKRNNDMGDHNENFIYDDALFRLKGTYAALKSTSFEIWYDDGKSITQQIPSTITDTTKIVADVYYDSDAAVYRAIINIENLHPSLIPDNYYGNTR